MVLSPHTLGFQARGLLPALGPLSCRPLVWKLLPGIFAWFTAFISQQDSALCSRKHTARAAAPRPPGRPLGGPSLLPLPPTGLSGGDPCLLLKVPGTLRAPRAVHRTRGVPTILYGFPTGPELRRGGHPEWHQRTCFGKGTSLGRRASCRFKRKPARDPGRDTFLLTNVKV